MNDALSISPYQPDDRDAVLALVPRLCVGVVPWRSEAGVRPAVSEWCEESIDAAGDDQAVFVAQLDGQVVGTVAVGEQRHWSGDARVHRRAADR